MFRLLLVGAGTIAREHAKAAMNPMVCPDGAEVHVTDPSPQALDLLTEAIPGSRVHADLHTMLAMQPTPNETVVVATPPDAHANTARQALASRRHVLVEKPLTTEAAAARELVLTGPRKRSCTGLLRHAFQRTTRQSEGEGPSASRAPGSPLPPVPDQQTEPRPNRI
jgi:hypothetical protein